MPKAQSSCVLTPAASQIDRAVGCRAHRLARARMSVAVGPCSLLLALLLIPTLIGAQPATTRYVSPADPTCAGNQPCYPSIQAAVVAAVAGDTVTIQAGRYNEQLSIQWKNNTDSATEADRILIEADPQAALGSVILAGPDSPCESAAIRVWQSRFVTLRGLTITRSGGPAIRLLGGANPNHAIHIERNRVYRNVGLNCDGGIRIEPGNSATLIVNNLIYGNSGAGVRFLGPGGGPHYVVNNTIHASGGSGIAVVGDSQVLVVNNAITGNGLTAGSTQSGYGIQLGGSSASGPAGIQLLHNLICGNRRGEIHGTALDDTDAGNLTPTGTEGPGVGTSPGCELPTTVYAEVAGADGRANTADDDFILAPASPAIGQGLDPRTLGLDSGLDALFEADFVGPDARLAADSGGGFDIGAIARNSLPVPDPQPPQVTIISPRAGGFLRGAAAVQAQAAALDAVTGLTLRAGSQSLTSSLQPAPPARATTATATWQTATVPDGVYTLTAAARDTAGRTTTASRLAIVDNTPPDTQITSGPASTASGTAPTFTFSGSDNLTAGQNLVFAWRVDGHAFTAFTSSTTAQFTGLTAGSHTFQVKARDQAGNEDPRPASLAFTVSSPPAPSPAPAYALTITTAGTGAGTTAGAGSYAAGATVTMTATPASSSTFAGWSGDAVCAPTFTMPSRAVTCTATFTLAPAPGPTPPPPATPSLTLAYSGLLRDRVGQNNGALTPDGLMDGTFVATFGSAGILTQLTLTRTGPIGIWDTISATNYWTLGVASGLDSPILNGPGDAVQVAVAAAGTLTLFASDTPASLGAMFAPGSEFTLTATFADGQTATGKVTLPGAPPPPPPPPPPPAQVGTVLTWAQRAAQPGVLAAFAMNGPTDIDPYKVATGALGLAPTYDATLNAMNFTMPNGGTVQDALDNSAVGGYWRYSIPWAQQFDANSEFQVQFLVRDSDWVTEATDKKVMIWGAGDRNPSVPPVSGGPTQSNSGEPNNIILTTNFRQNIIQAYNATPNSDYGSGFSQFLYIDYNANGLNEIWLQSGVPSCQYHRIGQAGICTTLGQDVWQAFTIRCQLGPRLGDFLINSTCWIAFGWEGHPSTVLNAVTFDYYAPMSDASFGTPVPLIGKLWLFPYRQTSYDEYNYSGVNATGFTGVSGIASTYPVGTVVTDGSGHTLTTTVQVNPGNTTVTVDSNPTASSFASSGTLRLWKPLRAGNRWYKEVLIASGSTPLADPFGSAPITWPTPITAPNGTHPTPITAPVSTFPGLSAPPAGQTPSFSVNLAANTWQQISPVASTRTLCHNFTVDSAPTAQSFPMSREYGGIRIGGGYLFDFGGAHGGHPCNDVELYDIAGNMWRQAFPPHAVPPSDTHCYQGVYAYGGCDDWDHPDNAPWTEHTGQEFTWYPAQNAFFGLISSGTWKFTPSTGLWTRLAEGPGGFSAWLSTTGNLGVVRWGTFYDPVTGLVHAVVSGATSEGVWTWNGTTWVYKGPLPASGWSGVYSAYLPTIQRHLVQVHDRWWHYDPLGAGTWVEKTNVPVIDAFDFDSVNGVLIAVQHRADPIAMWAYTPATDVWTALGLPAVRPVQTAGLQAWGPLMVYDASHNLFWFLAQSGGSGGTGGTNVQLWAYRYQ